MADCLSGTLVNLSTGHAAKARDLAAWAARRGVDYLEGAILTPAPTIGTPAATILYSGPSTVFEQSRGILAGLGGSSVYLGEDIGLAAAYDMALLDLFAISVGGLAHAFALAVSEGIEPTAFARFATGMGTLIPGLIDKFATQLTEKTFAADVSSIASAGSAVAHVREAAIEQGVDVGPLLALQSIIDRAIEAGYGGDSYARLAHLLVPDHRPAPSSRVPE